MLDREKYNIERDEAMKAQIAELSGYFERFIRKNLDVRDKNMNQHADEETVRKIMDIPICREGRDPKEVGREIEDLVLSTATILRHPRFFSFVNGAVSPYSVAGEILTCLYNPNMCAYMLSSGPMLVEDKLIRWAAGRAGFDTHTCGGVFTSGGSLSNLTGMICGREAKLPGRYDLANAVAFCSSQAHSSIRKGMRMMGLRSNQIVIIDTDESFRIRTDILQTEVERTIAEGKKPFLIVGTVGTTNTGSIDPLNELADIAEKYDMWFHVDGAYGGSILISDIYKNLAKGLERADSFSWDFHKWALQTYSCSCVIAKDKNNLLNAFSEHPEYLEDIMSTEHNDGWDLGIEMSRPARSIKLWYTIQAMGTDLLADVIDYSFFNASLAAKRFAEADDWTLISKPMCGTINVRYEPKSVDPALYDRLNTKISEEIIGSGYAYIVTTVLNGKKCLRIITINGNTETADVLNTVEKLRQIAEKVRIEAVLHTLRQCCVSDTEQKETDAAAGEVSVRRYEEKDLDAVYEMINKAFMTPALDKVYENHVKAFWLSEYTRENIAASAEKTHLYVAELNGEIVGSGAIGIDGELAYISAVFINPFIQGKGIGTGIIRALEQDEICETHKKLYLTASLSAGKFYKKLGYTFKYDVPEIVMDGCLDVVYMEKELK